MLFAEDLGNFLCFIVADALDFRQKIRLFLNHIKRCLTEALHNPLCRFRPDALNHSRGKIFLHPCRSGRHGFFVIPHLYLPAVKGVHGPASVNFQCFAAVNLRHNAHAGHLIILCCQRKNRIAVILIPVNDILHLAGNFQILHAFPSLPFFRLLKVYHNK